jgi:DNA-binding XRE family transcriptional regulator
MAIKAETRPHVPIVAGEAPHALPERAPQILKTLGGERLIVLVESDYKILVDAARDNIADAEAAIEAAKVLARLESGEERPIPFAVMQRITAGENRIKVLREWAGLTQAELAGVAGTAAAYISQLETGAARGGLDTLGKIAAALGLPVELVIPKLTDEDFPMPASRPKPRVGGLLDPGKRALDLGAPRRKK